mgnify:CR=1 FL=1
MNRALVLAAGTAAIVAGTLAGCSSDKSTSEQVSSATDSAKSAASSVSEAVTGDAGDSKVTVDGADQKVEGPVVCTAMGGNVQIAIGNATTGIGAQLTEGDSPAVKQVGLGNVNGVALGFTEGAPGGEATATKDGNTYTIKGTATGVDMANPMQPMTKPFEIAVTCP